MEGQVLNCFAGKYYCPRQGDSPKLTKNQFQLAQWARDVNRLIERSNRHKKVPTMKYKVKNRDRGMSR